MLFWNAWAEMVPGPLVSGDSTRKRQRELKDRRTSRPAARVNGAKLRVRQALKDRSALRPLGDRQRAAFPWRHVTTVFPDASAGSPGQEAAVGWLLAVVGNWVGITPACEMGEYRNPSQDDEDAIAGVGPVVLEGVTEKSGRNGYENDGNVGIAPHAVGTHRLRLALPEHKDGAARDHVEKPFGKNR